MTSYPNPQYPRCSAKAYPSPPLFLSTPAPLPPSLPLSPCSSFSLSSSVPLLLFLPLFLSTPASLPLYFCISLNIVSIRQTDE